MSKAPFSKIHYWIIFLLLIFCSTCSIPGPKPYPVANPIIFAYNHEIDLDSFELEIASDTLLGIQKVEEGFLFYAGFDSNWATELVLYINDSLLLVKVNAFSSDYFDDIHKTSGKVRHEQDIRNRRKRLLEDLTDHFYANQMQFLNKPSFEWKEGYYSRNHSSMTFAFPVVPETLRPVDTLSWSGSHFGDSIQVNFGNGEIEGSAFIYDNTRKLGIEGFYKKGMEIGDWKIRDSIGQLQWTEQYIAGELQEVSYTPDAYKTRPKPLPTFKATVFLHRSVFYGLFLLSVLVVYFYIKYYGPLKNPYKGKKTIMVILQILGSPIFALLTLFLFGFGFLLIAGLFEKQTVWDIPFDLDLGVSLMVVYFFAGTFYFGLTAKYIDVLWHTVLFFFIFLMIEEHNYLQSLGVGLF